MSSPWAYIGHAAFMDVAARHGAAVIFRPLAFRRLFPETGGLPLPRRHPVRQRYRMIELQRWRARRGVPLNLEPKHYPFDPTALDRIVTALAAAGGDADPFMRRAFAAIWAENRDPADPATVEALAVAAALPTEILEQAAGPAIERRYEANLQAALSAGVFGAPSYVLDGEVFWGQDRLELLDEALASGRAPYRTQ